MPMDEFISTGFYFSSFLFLASALLLAALYKYRWKSNTISLFLWLPTLALCGVFAWLITGYTIAVIIVIGFNLLLVFGFIKLAKTISLFGIFFLISMIIPPIYGVIWLFELANSVGNYFNIGRALFVLTLLIPTSLSILIIISAAMWAWIVLVRYSELYFRFPRLQAARKMIETEKTHFPWISIHVPCYAEPPEIVIQSLDALARLQYPHFEVIVLDNNTKDPQLWKPLESHCQKLGERFRFFHFDSLKGAKAGALNAALRLTAPHIELISVIDADYVVQPDFLDKLVGLFENPKIGFVQSCQDYRDWKGSLFRSSCYFEYQIHFKLELPGQNEWDTGYTIGTMCLLRRKIVEKVGGWAEWCLTEDSEMAIRIHALGYEGHYLKDTFGYGLIPETFDDYKKQRFRWTAGPVQQIQKHWRLYLPWFSKGRLTSIQKVAEIFHSLSVFFSETLNNILNIPILGVCLWFAISKQHHFTLPFVLILFIPLVIIRNMLCYWIHIRLLNGNRMDCLLSAIAARSLIYTRNMAFYKAWLLKNLKWVRTQKFKASTNLSKAFNACRSEIIGAILYIFFAAALAYFASFKRPDIIFFIWLGIVNQMVSYLCAPIMTLLSERELRK